MKLIAHRGHSKKYPENTMIAFEKAIDAGADGIELDIHFTTDKKVIVHHYFELGQTDNGSGFIFQKDLAYLQSLDAGSWFGEEFKVQRMPLLKEVFASLGTKTTYEVEMKSGSREFVDEVIKITQEYSLVSSVQFTSYQYPLVSYIKRKLPDATIGFIAPTVPSWMNNDIAHEIIKSHLVLGEVDVLHAPVAIWNQRFINELHALGVKVHFGLADTLEQLQKAKELGADELTTNDIELAVNLRNQ